MDGESYCADCGLVVFEDRLDRGPEWRYFDDGNPAPERVGAPLTPARHDRGLSTEIGFDAVASARKRRQLIRLRRQHGRSKFRSKAERNLAVALGEIARLVSALDLSYAVRERASVIYRRAQAASLLPGRSIEAIAAGSLYAACRCGGVTRSTAEVASFARCSADEVELGYRLLNRELGLAALAVRPDAYVPKLASAVGAPDRVRRRALELAERAEAAGLANGRHPGGLAAACVYRAGHEAGQLYTQKELATVVDVTPTTLRSRLVELRERGIAFHYSEESLAEDFPDG